MGAPERVVTLQNWNLAVFKNKVGKKNHFYRLYSLKKIFAKGRGTNKEYGSTPAIVFDENEFRNLQTLLTQLLNQSLHVKIVRMNDFPRGGEQKTKILGVRKK